MMNRMFTLRPKVIWRLALFAALLSVSFILWEGLTQEVPFGVLQWFSVIALPILLPISTYYINTLRIIVTPLYLEARWHFRIGPWRIWDKRDCVLRWNDVTSVTGYEGIFESSKAFATAGFTGISQNGKMIQISIGPYLEGYENALLYALTRVPNRLIPKHLQEDIDKIKSSIAKNDET